MRKFPAMFRKDDILRRYRKGYPYKFPPSSSCHYQLSTINYPLSTVNSLSRQLGELGPAIHVAFELLLNLVQFVAEPLHRLEI